VIKQFIKKLIQYYIDLIVSWYRKIKTYFNLNYEIKKYHESFDKPKKPVIKKPKIVRNKRNNLRDPKFIVITRRKIKKGIIKKTPPIVGVSLFL